MSSILGSIRLGILYLGRYGRKCYTSVVLGESDDTLLREGKMHPFVHLSIVF